MTERSIVHAWKACVPKGTGGSNPPPSALQLALAPRALIRNDLPVRTILTLIFFVFGSVALAQTNLPALSHDLSTAKQAYLNGNFDEALAALDRADKSGSTAQSLDLRGRIYREQGKLDEAAKAFESAHLSDYDAFGPRIHIADLMLQQKKFSEARSEYEKLLDLVKSPMWPDYLRFGILMSSLGEHNQSKAREARAAILFPTETPAYYYAQAAWAFDHGNNSEGRKWVQSAKKIFDVSKTGWFDRLLYQFGWLKKKPSRTIDPFSS